MGSRYKHKLVCAVSLVDVFTIAVDLYIHCNNSSYLNSNLKLFRLHYKCSFYFAQ